jgi:mannose-6-phosphate isomerase
MIRALTFEPWLEERVWGGRELERFGKKLPPDRPIGESWEVSDLEGKSSKVARDPLRGRLLSDLVRSHARDLLGSTALRGAGGAPGLPLVKLLDARQDLSVQLHPSDADLRAGGIELAGKTETWVILGADPGARIVHGIAPGVPREEFFDRMAAVGSNPLPPGESESLFRWEAVTAGHVVHVPAGTVHTVGRGIVLLEVQQPSDITYRIHDWGRPGSGGRPRDLHVDDARRVAQPPAVPRPFPRIDEAARAGAFAPIAACEAYGIEVLELSAAPGARGVRSSTRDEAGGGFHILAGIEGEAAYSTPEGDRLDIRRGAFVLLPAALGEYALEATSDRARIIRIQGAG